MSNNYNHYNMGDQFKDAVSKGLASGDFRELNSLVTDTVTDAIAAAGKQVKNTSYTYQKTTYKTVNDQSRYRNYTYTSKPSQPKTNLPATKVRNVGQVSSVLYMVFGGIGTGFSSIGLLIFGLIGLLGSLWVPKGLIAFGITGAISAWALRKGVLERDRLSRVKRYVALCADKMYINIADLANHVGKSSKYVLKDVKKMLELGFFPEGHLDKEETCFMLDDKTYREYLNVEHQRRMLTQNTSAESQVANQATANESNNAELEAMIREGQEYIRKLHELNEIIPEESISNKMYRMESLLQEIFARLKEDPKQMPQMHKLMNYYLPTTIKLLQSYSEFDDVSNPGQEIISAKSEIEKTVDTINEAFAELLNKLFQASVFDATTDAQVLQTMLAKEGLTKNDFSEDKR